METIVDAAARATAALLEMLITTEDADVAATDCADATALMDASWAC